MYFLAVGHKNDFPLLTWLVDAYSLDKTKYYVETEKTLLLDTWIDQNPFMRDLRQESTKRLNKLKAAMVSYSNRILPRLQFTPPTKVYDDIKAIADYATAMPFVIEQLISDRFTDASPPFCVCYSVALISDSLDGCTSVLC